AGAAFDVLLSHDGPRDAVIQDAGSEEISALLHLAQPAFAFFGHYSRTGHRVPEHFGRTQVYLLSGFEMRHRGGCAEDGSVGLLTWQPGGGTFAFLEPDWLRTFTRHNWQHR